MKKQNIRNIIVPIDFSRMSVQALKSASQLAERFGASIHLAHVRQFNYATDFVAPSPPIVPFSFTPYHRDGKGEITKELNELARECGISSPICHVLGGAPPFDEICRLAQEIPADLIVMPTHGRTGLKHVFLGSTAERIVQHSPCPVLVARRNALQFKKSSRLTIKRILVPVDFSDCSREGLRYALRFANEFKARIVLLHATYLGYIYSSEGIALYDVRGLQKAARENAEHQMRNFVRAAKFGRVKYETAFTEGSPAADICALAKEHNVDLIITSTHGLTGLKHVLIGSVAEQVVRHAPCAVLVVPSHPQIRATNLSETRALETRTLTSKRQSRRSPKSRTLTKRDRRLASPPVSRTSEYKPVR